MKASTVALLCTRIAFAAQSVILPPNSSSWRSVSIMPSVWLTDTTYYALFDTTASDY